MRARLAVGFAGAAILSLAAMEPVSAQEVYGTATEFLTQTQEWAQTTVLSVSFFVALVVAALFAWFRGLGIGAIAFVVVMVFGAIIGNSDQLASFVNIGTGGA